MNNKPREFWIDTLGGYIDYQEPTAKSSGDVHVIEYIAYEQAMKDCKHPGCCCVCGHQGRCPEDGPTAGITDAITD